MVGNEDNVDISKSHSCSTTLNVHNPKRACTSLKNLNLPGKSRVILCILYSPESGTLGFVWPFYPDSQSVRCGSFYDGVNGDHLQEGLCHTRSTAICCNSHTADCTIGDTQTQFCLCLCEVSESLAT